MSVFDENLERALKKYEGRMWLPTLPTPMHYAYQDHLGKWTIGYGFVLENPKTLAPIRATLARVTKKTVEELIARTAYLTMEEGEALFKISTEIAVRDARSLVKDFDSLSEPRKLIIICMSFQLGHPSLSGFQTLIKELNKPAGERDYTAITTAMVDSKWAMKDTPERAADLADGMLHDRYPPAALEPARVAKVAPAPAPAPASAPNSPPPGEYPHAGINGDRLVDRSDLPRGGGGGAADKPRQSRPPPEPKGQPTSMGKNIMW